MFCLDYKMSGVGSNSCGPELLPQVPPGGRGIHLPLHPSAPVSLSSYMGAAPPGGSLFSPPPASPHPSRKPLPPSKKSACGPREGPPALLSSPPPPPFSKKAGRAAPFFRLSSLSPPRPKTPAPIKKSACGPREGPPALFSFLSPQFSQALGTRRSRHSRYFSWVLATTSSGRSGAGVTPASLLSVSQSRRYCLS